MWMSKKMFAFYEFAYVKNKETDVNYFTGYKTGKKNRSSLITPQQLTGYPNKDEKLNTCPT